MAPTSQAKRFRKESALLQMLEDSTDSELSRSLFHSDESNMHSDSENQTNVDEIRAYMGVLIYMWLVDLPEIDDYFLEDFCVCPTVRQAMTSKRFRKLGQYLHLNSQENRPGPQDKNFDILYSS
jgi:hypothetical protein